MKHNSLPLLLLAFFSWSLQAQPVITLQPTNQTIFNSSNVTFKVIASGTGPFTYQWQFNATNLTNNPIITVAGTGSHGYSGDGGIATTASLYTPFGVAFDAAGSFYVGDTDNNRIRKVDANGVITTVAGIGPSLPNYGGYSGDGGMATNANLNKPRGVAFDKTGNLYFADTENFRVRKVDTNGIITTVAGNGNYGYSGDGGAATNANIFQPYGVSTDVAGNLYIADTLNSRIRKVDTNGIITTMAGIGPSWPSAGDYSGDGDAATNASLNNPLGMALDAAGNLYIADTSNGRIRKVDTNGIITTVAGNGGLYFSGNGGAATNATLYAPHALILDNVGNMYIADTYNNRIRKVDTNGIITSVVGNGYGANGSGGGAFSGDGGAATNASLWNPTGVAFDPAGNLFFVDRANERVRAVFWAGMPTLTLSNITPANAGNYTVIITGADGSVTSQVAVLTIVVPPAIIIQPFSPGGSNATLSVAAIGTQPLDYSWYFSGTNLVQSGTNTTLNVSSIDAGNVGQYFVVVTNLYGSVTSQVATIAFAPTLLLQSSNQIVVSGFNTMFKGVGSGSDLLNYQWQFNGSNLPNNIIITVAGTGTSSYSGDGGPATNAGIFGATGVATDGAGNFYIADRSSRIRKVNTNGIISTFAGTNGSGFTGDGGPANAAKLNGPYCIATDVSGNIYIADTVNNRIRKLDTNGIISTMTGNGTAGFSGDGGAATNAMINSPRGIALDVSGNLLIADYSNNRIRKVDTNGIITTIAGKGSGSFSGDGGAATNATLGSPQGVAADALGNIFIADYLNNRIRRVDTNGVIITVAGNGTAYQNTGDGGAATNGCLTNPTGVVADSYGYLFIADWNGNRIRQVSPNGIISTVAGDGSSNYHGDGGDATNASIYQPFGVAFDASGSILIADMSHSRVRKATLGRSPLLGLNNLTTNAAGNYQLILTSPFGTVTSSIINLAVVITLSPQNLTVTNGNLASLAVGAYGSGLFTYQWYFNTNTMIASGTNATLNFINTPFNAMGNYICIVSNASGSVTSRVVTLTVLAAPNITTQPHDVAVVKGGATNLTVVASGTVPLGYKWFFNTNTAVNGGTNAILSFASVTNTTAGNYVCVVSNAYGSVTSVVASLTVLLPPSIAAQPVNITVTNGGSTNFNVAVSGTAPFTYQWFSTSGRNATAVPNVIGGRVQAVFVTSGGAGYSSVPSVQFIGGSGSGASGTAVVNSGMVTAITINNMGSGYFITPPTIQISGPSAPSSALSNRTNAALSLAPVIIDQATNYFVVAMNDYGSVTSVIVTLTVLLPPQNFTAQNFGAGLKLQLTGTPNYPYVLQLATNLTPPLGWKSIRTNFSDANGNWSFTVTNGSGVPAGFYRAVGQ